MIRLQFVILGIYCIFISAHSAVAQATRDDLLLRTMQQELTRAQKELGKLDPAPYYISYAVHDDNSEAAVGTLGTLVNSGTYRRRAIDVVMRVGTPELDNSHSDSRSSAITSGALPIEDDANAIAHVLWQLTFTEYRKAQQAYLNIKTKTQVNAKEEDTSADFSKESPQSHVEYTQLAPGPEQSTLEKLVRS